ncbi:hypothetical protein [Janthinobacterium agaricidamnosum]|uniref:Uncharacterized protein n=1 Tax=Janthinobacterium agaricidamnosum NBRC 102515 = DSM 9628 TaxID=1349767 RepID=W0V6E1_9BURK|nr:hypothetical protein [Janthinobacterium agaricidamnosum]CDG82842.1 putative uncharacterized protein [Janthinobacterium agaricidamnosum NBRC 102515 = DSM 9628]
MNRRLLDYMPVMEIPDQPGLADAGETARLDDESEMVLGAQLLEVRNPAQLDLFLSGLVADTGAGAAALSGTPLGGALLQALRRAALAVLPIRGAPAEALKNRAATIFGLELEGLSPEDKEFELARHLVRFAGAVAGDVANNVAKSSRAGGDRPRRQVQAALLDAARSHAPGLLGLGQVRLRGRPGAGRWQRQGSHIVVLDG